MTFFQQDPRDALDAKQYAQWIAFGPSVFQAARSLRDCGALEAVEAAREAGLDFDGIAARVELPRYGLRVLLEAGLGIGLLVRRDGRFHTTRTAWFILHDRMTRANMDFTHEVNYRALFALDESLRSGRPEGLKTFGPWNTVYEGLPHLPEPAREAWMRFVHYYSDSTFNAALPLVFERRPQRLMDIGGNTGRWARLCLEHDDRVEVTIADLPGLALMARQNLADCTGHARLRLHELDLLDPAQALPVGHDAIWMSQFLDCFGEAGIVSILRRCDAALAPGGRLYILEPFWDRQKFEAAAFCLQQTSLYFTVMANGRSQMYESTLFLDLLRQAGFVTEREHDHLGVSHTLLVCKRVREAD